MNTGCFDRNKDILLSVQVLEYWQGKNNSIKNINFGYENVICSNLIFWVLHLKVSIKIKKKKKYLFKK